MVSFVQWWTFRNLSYLSASGNCRRLFLGLRRSSPATITTSAPTPATAPVADSPRRRNSIASSTVGMPAQVSKFGENKPFTYRNVCFGGRNFRGPKQTFGHPRNVLFRASKQAFFAGRWQSSGRTKCRQVSAQRKTRRRISRKPWRQLNKRNVWCECGYEQCREPLYQTFFYTSVVNTLCITSR